MIATKRIFLTAVRAGVLAFFTVGLTARAATSPIRVNEIMYDPPQQTSGANLDWMELYNQGSAPITVIGGAGQGSWTIQDAYGTHYLATQPFVGSMTIPQGNYGVLADDPQAFMHAYPSFRGTLINASITFQGTQGFILIRDGQGAIIAQASWDQAQGAAGNGKTLEYSTQDNAFREGLRIGGSPGLANSVEGILLPPVKPSPTPAAQMTPAATPSGEQPKQEAFPVINEIYSNPFPDQPAWLELKNETSQRIDLDGWNLLIGSQQRPVALNGVMEPGSLMLVSGSAWGFSLNQRTDSVQVVDSQKTVVFKVSYSSPLPQGWSANRIANGSWQASSKPTPGTPNIIRLSNVQPSSIPASEIIPPVGADAYHPTAAPENASVASLSPIALGFALGAGIAGVIAFVIVKKRLLY